MMYTYCHPLSLPHALPVSAAYARTMCLACAAGAEHLVHPAVPGAPVGPGSDQVQARSLQATSCRHRVADSVEHGSEARSCVCLPCLVKVVAPAAAIRAPPALHP